MGDSAGPDDGDFFGRGVAGDAQRLAEFPGTVQRRQRRPLAVYIHRDHRHVVARRQEMQRHHDAVIELPFLYRSAIRLAHPDAEGGHVVHEEIREMFRADHDKRFGAGCLDRLAHAVETFMQAFALCGIRPVGAGGDSRRVAACACKYQRHRSVSYHGVNSGADRAVRGNAVAHRLKIVVPGESPERRIMHQQLPVDADDI